MSLPSKYIKIDGVMMLNPAYTSAQAAAQPSAPPLALYPDTAMPVFSNMHQVDDYRSQSGVNVQLAPAAEASFVMIGDPDFTGQTATNGDAMLRGLSDVFVKHEVPLGLMNKLLDLKTFDEIEFIVDDSGSMRKTTIGGGTRWSEALQRLKQMVEFLAFLPTPTIFVRFLNRPDKLLARRHNDGETPLQFRDHVWREIDALFASPATGKTPIFKYLVESFKRGEEKEIVRFLFCDGEPSGGADARKAISKLVCERQNPQRNPIALFSCSDSDEDVEWMKELEEVASYCSEYDDFEAEAREVHRDQGTVFPYTRGFYMIGQLVMGVQDLPLNKVALIVVAARLPRDGL